MWNLLRKNNEECRRTQDSLEEIARRRHARGVVSAEELLADLPVQERTHAVACNLCREAAQDLLTTRELLRGIPRADSVNRPFFASRVMAAIAAREKELANLISPWTEVPRFAARLAWITGLVLLAGTTWFYERGMTTPNRNTNGDANQESIFETPPPSNQDDVLISMEMHP
jgi:hypothetical protein